MFPNIYNMRSTKKDEIGVFKWWKQIHVALFVAGVLTFGLLDGFTAMLMVGKYGISSESNPLLREIIYAHGPVCFLVFKVVGAALVLSAPFLLYKKEDLGWTTAGFLSVFTVGGIVAAVDNYLYLMSGQIWIAPQIVIGAMLIMTMTAIHFGDILDSKKTSQKAVTFKISDVRWEAMKREMGYPCEC
ncbi:hypothetical protein C5S31_01925 [ANME-1 cluster archaeon GoMg2]|nr:hypothetical protein [ANME-1 cluster archaeon GoMg2]